MHDYIERSLEPVLKRAASEFPAVVLTGPRQAGKTTLLQRVFGGTCRYLSLDLPDVRAAAVADPRGFLEMNGPPVIFDEVQHAPNLLPYIRERIDADRGARGRYLLTGSQNLMLAESVTESLAGRAAVLRLFPLSRREAEGRPGLALPWEGGPESRPAAGVGPSSDASGPARRGAAFGGLWQAFLRGGYPELAADPGRDPFLWHASYMQTYLERDVRTLRNVGDLNQYQSFLRVLAARSAQLLNLADVARDLGVAVNTAKAWLSVLEATYQVIVLRPYFANVGKRLVKTPKVYFTDVGTLCHLVGLRDSEHAAFGPISGAIMETAVLSEIVRTLTHRGEAQRVWFWRTRAGTEVDFVVETGGSLVPVEVKASATPRPGMANAIRTLQRDLGDAAAPGYVVHSGDVRLPLGRGTTALPFGEL